MRRCLWPRVVQTQVAELNGTRGLAERRAGGIQHPGRGGGKDTGLESRMPGGVGAGSEDTEEGPGSQTPPLPRRLPLRCVWVRLRAGALQTSLLFPGEKPSLLVVSRS